MHLSVSETANKQLGISVIIKDDFRFKIILILHSVLCIEKYHDINAEQQLQYYVTTKKNEGSISVQAC